MKLVFLPIVAAVAGSVLLFSACGNRNTRNGQAGASEISVASDVVSSRDSVRWNALTPDQRAMYEKLEDVMLKHLRVENNRVSLAMSKADFLAAGLPDSCYVRLSGDLEAMNSFADSTKVDMNELVNQFKHSICCLHEK